MEENRSFLSIREKILLDLLEFNNRRELQRKQLLENVCQGEAKLLLEKQFNEERTLWDALYKRALSGAADGEGGSLKEEKDDKIKEEKEIGKEE